MVKFILTVPDRLKSAVLEQMLAWRTEVASEFPVEIRVVEKRERQERASQSRPEATADVTVVVHAQASGSPVLVPTVAPPVDRSTKVYRVIDTAAYVGPIPHMIRMYLIDHPNSTCRQIIDATGRGQKSVESAIWMLRNKGIVRESEKA